MNFLTTTDATSKAIIPTLGTESLNIVGGSEEEFIEVRILRAGEVTTADINNAENFGVMAGLKRHLNCEPEVKMRAALQIMELIYERGYRAKVSMFIRGHGETLLNDLDKPALKAEFAIRVARMMDRGGQQGSWCEAAMILLKDETARLKCPKMSLEMLAMIWAEVGNHELVIHWLAAAGADREKYKKATLQFFLRGAFDEGMTILDEAPKAVIAETQTTSYNPDNFIELVAYGFRHKEIFEDNDYRKSILRYQKEWQHQKIILRALCHFSLMDRALSLSKEMVFHADSIYPMMVLSDYITGVDERRDYMDALLAVGQQINEKKKETNGYGQLNFLVKSKQLFISEAIAMASFIPTAAPRVSSLWERACGIRLKRDKVVKDLRDLQMVLKAIVTHLGSTKAIDYVHGYWGKVLRMQVKHGLLEDAKAVEESWRKWRLICGEGSNQSVRLSNEIHVLCFFGLFKYLDGDTEGAIADFDDAVEIRKVILEESPKSSDDLNNWIRSVVGDLKNGPVKLTSSQKTILTALVRHPRSYKQIFKCEADLAIIVPLEFACVKVASCLLEITQLTSQSRGKRAVQSFQGKKLDNKVLSSLKKVKTAAAEALKVLLAYRDGFTEEASIKLAKELDACLQRAQEKPEQRWSFRKIRKLILPLGADLSTLLDRLKKQRLVLDTELKEFMRRW